MNDELLDQVLQCPRLPSLPAVAARVLELTSDNDICMEELARTVVKDQAMAGRVLQTVNSSFYGLRARCTTIRRALVLLGLSPVKSLVLSFSLISAVEESDYEDLDLESHWRRALYTATAARLVLLRVGEKDASDAGFLGGLLQDVGVIAMRRTLGDAYRRVLREAGGDHRELSRVEMEQLEVSHAEVGAMLGAHWRLPEALTVPIRYHERPTAAPSHCSAVVRAVVLGNLIHDVLTDAEPAPILRQVYRRGEEWFLQRRANMDDLMHEVSASVEELRDLFRLDTGSSPSSESILASAHERLDAERAQSPVSRAVADDLDSLLVGAEGPDALTGMYSREALERLLRSAFYFGGSKGEPVSLAIFSVDRFAEVCREGPEGLDLEITLGVSMLLKEHFDGLGGAIARVSPDMFAVVVPEAARETVTAAADRFRAALASHSPQWNIPDYSGRFRLTASVGVVTASGPGEPFETPEQMRAMAMRAAQGAREAGGNALRAFVPREAA